MWDGRIYLTSNEGDDLVVLAVDREGFHDRIDDFGEHRGQQQVPLMDIDPPVAAVECGLLVVGEAEGKDGQGQGQLFTQEQIWQSLGVIVLAFFKN